VDKSDPVLDGEKGLRLLYELVRLEVKRGCVDDAAQGGFSKLARTTLNQALRSTTGRKDNSPSRRLHALFVDYDLIARGERRRRCAEALAILAERPSATREEPAPRSSIPAVAPVQSAQEVVDILERPVSAVRGVGPAMQTALAHMGLLRLGDLLLHAPRQYVDVRVPTPIGREALGKNVFLRATVVRLSEFRRGMLIVKAAAKDSAGRPVSIIWFNNRFVHSRLQTDRQYDFYGRLQNSFDGVQLVQPTFEVTGSPQAQLHMNRIVPLYHLTAGVSQKIIRQQVWNGLEMLPRVATDYVPRDVAAAFHLRDVNSSYRALHFPGDESDAETARQRFAFDSLFLFELRILQERTARDDRPGHAFPLHAGTVEQYIAFLPFAPTASQAAAMHDIEGDVRQPRRMNRLLHGDVGSGKTAVAGYAAFAAQQCGYQSVVMSPTEILAEQTGRVLAGILGPAGVRVETLTGSTPKSMRNGIVKRAIVGEVDCLVGTHALIEEALTFARLGLVIVDEQHRFGVAQRSALGEKGTDPHTLVMSATPIPRTLALTIYGDLDISELPEKPPGMRPVETLLFAADCRMQAYDLVRHEVAQGHQAFVVVPAIDAADDDTRETATVEETLKELSEGPLKGLRIGCLHGRQKADAKSRAMSEFREGAIDVLVATTVVEVGVDIPNASVMVIENAERFGLATLHQLRGRVGRGSAQSKCLLIHGGGDQTASARLQVLVESQDGFDIAEQDLRLRGPGDILGTVQHGFDVPVFGSTGMLTYHDLELLPRIRAAAEGVLAGDPGLASAEHGTLARMLSLRFPRQGIQRVEGS
jgi:ATP-dependent DNA helicase RecG